MSSFPFRQIHLDFHTSEHIPGVGSAFDPEQFVRTLKAGNVDSVTLFAKCHHGWSYYPTKVGVPHPNLEVPDLLGEMISACRRAGIQTPVYITVQWDELTAREHPEWRVVKAQHGSFQSLGQSGGDADLNQMDPQWHPVSVIHDELVERIIRQSLEIINFYDPEGLFLDILLPWQDVSARNLARMESRGLDPEKEADRLQNDREVIMAYYERFGEAIRKVSPKTRIFHNSGHIYKGERERWQHFSHLELESLPTGGWGYDHFPLSALYASQLKMPFLGMTGKFHTMWGEFGGFKTATALEYECAQMVALGARCSIGDQLHPSGHADEATYDRIGPAYARVRQLEPYLSDVEPVASIGILSAEAHLHNREAEPVDIGAARVLLESQQTFHLLDWDSDFSALEVLILPDTITLDAQQAKRIQAFLDKGGKVLSTGGSLMDPDTQAFALDTGATVHGERAFQPDYILAGEQLQGPFPMVKSPFVTYRRGYAIKPAGAEVLAQLLDPYFNRSWKHFCSHQHTPYATAPNEDLVAAFRYKNLIHFSHPLFREYYESGQPLTKALILNALRLLQPEPAVATNLPTSARLSWMRQSGQHRDILHLLFAQTQLRGAGLPGWHGNQKMEIIEDAVPLHEVEVTFRPTGKVKKVYSAYQPETPLELKELEGGKVHIRLPRLYLHEAIVVENA